MLNIFQKFIDNSKYSRDWENIKGININFQFRDGKLIFNKDDMQNSINKMKNEIKFSENKSSLENQYLEMKQKFKVHPELLRGHTLFELLECYLNIMEKQ